MKTKIGQMNVIDSHVPKIDDIAIIHKTLSQSLVTTLALSKEIEETLQSLKNII